MAISANGAVLGKSVWKFFAEAGKGIGASMNKGGAWTSVGENLSNAAKNFKSSVGSYKQVNEVMNAVGNPADKQAAGEKLLQLGFDSSVEGYKGIGRAAKAMFLPEALGGSAGWGTRMGTYAAGAYGARVVTGGGLNPLRRKNSDRRDIIGIPFI